MEADNKSANLEATIVKEEAVPLLAPAASGRRFGMGDSILQSILIFFSISSASFSLLKFHALL